MIKLFSIVAVAVPAIALAATAGIAGEPTKSFTHAGVTYVYEATPATDGGTVLSGRVLETGAKFSLVVKDGKVSGHTGRHPVNFPVAATRGAADGAVVINASTRLSSAD